MIIEKAQIEDIPEIVGLIREFFNESLRHYKFSLDDLTIYETVTNYVKNHIAIVARKNRIIGTIGGLVSPSIFDKNQLVGQETIWYVTKKERGKAGFLLIKEFEKRCKELGANLIAMVYMGNLNVDILNKYYKKRGYELMETQFIRVIK